MGCNSTGVKWVERAAGDGKLKTEDLVTTQRCSFWLGLFKIHFMGMIVLPTCVCVACMCSAQEKDTGSLGTGVTEHGDLLCGCWGPTLGPLQELEHPQLLSQPSRPWLGGLKHYFQFDDRRLSPRHLKVTSYVKLLSLL